MAYCRWSDDDGKSDVYVYRHVNKKYMIYVAKVPGRDVQNWVGLGHPSTGKEFALNSAQECLAKLKWLRDEGFHVPQHVFDRLSA